jgi:predicted RNase H-like HicB family nuclease
MVTMPDATHYTYRVAWSVEGGEHVSTVAEFPSLSWLAPTPVEALAGLADAVRDVLTDLAASGEVIPEPLSNAPTQANLWCVSRQKFTVVSSAKLPNSM